MLAASIDAMRDAVDDIASKSYAGASEVLAASERLSSDASRRSELSRRIEAFSDKIILHSRKISDVSVNLEHSVEQVDGVSEISVRQAEAALGGIEKMDRLMSGLGECAADFSGALAEIFEAGRKIGEIADSMTQLADRANLLSLNAAIEAEKAGEFGGGFAIVSAEIGKLADMTAVSAMNISKMVSDMRDSVESGVVEMRSFVILMRRSLRVIDRVSDNMRAVSEQVAALGPKFEELAGGVGTQADRAARISRTMHALSESAAQTRDKIGAFKSATDSLEKTAEELRAKVSQFKLPRLGGDPETL